MLDTAVPHLNTGPTCARLDGSTAKLKFSQKSPRHCCSCFGMVCYPRYGVYAGWRVRRRIQGRSVDLPAQIPGGKSRTPPALGAVVVRAPPCSALSLLPPLDYNIALYAVCTDLYVSRGRFDCFVFVRQLSFDLVSPRSFSVDAAPKLASSFVRLGPAVSWS